MGATQTVIWQRGQHVCNDDTARSFARFPARSMECVGHCMLVGVFATVSQHQGSCLTTRTAARDAADRSVYSLQVGADGICDEASPRAAREARRYKEDEISVEDRLSIVRQAEYLLSTGRKATSSSVAMRLQNKELPASKIKYILRHGRRTLGGCHPTVHRKHC